MNVLFLAGEYPPRPGGVGDYTALLARHLAAQGMRVSVLATGEDLPLAFPHKGGVFGERSAPGSSQVSGLRTQDYPVWRGVRRWDWGCGRRVLAAVRATRADVVHVQYQPAAFAMEPAACWLPGWLRRRCPGVRTVVTFHDLRVPYLFPKAGRLRAAVRDRLLRGADATIFTDPADWAAARAVRPAGRHWIPIGSNLAPEPPPDYERRAWRERVGARDSTLLIVHLGILNQSKGLDTLLNALVRLRAAGRDARLLLVGAEAGASDPSNHAYAAEVERWLAAPAVAPHVRRLPLVPAAEASAYLLAADVAAFPFVDAASLRRGSLLAALAHGVPTVSTGNGSNLLRPDETLVLVRAGDGAALAAALGRVADDPSLRARLAAGGPVLTAALAWPRIAAAHRAVYDRLVD